jgi:hypothetical protein
VGHSDSSRDSSSDEGEHSEHNFGVDPIETDSQKIAEVVRVILGSHEGENVTSSSEADRGVVPSPCPARAYSPPREQGLASLSVSSSSCSSSEESEREPLAQEVGERETSSPLRFQDLVLEKPPSKKVQDQITRKDHVTQEHLKKRKIKDIFRYMCCDKVCLRELGLDGCEKQRKYYFGLSQSERNILLRGCIQNNKGYCVNGHVLCRQGFKKLFSVGNNRLQKVNANVFQRIENITFCKDTSSTQLGLVQWLDDFFSKNVESLPNKDIHHLPDNWTKLEVYEEFKHETNF